MNYLSTRDLYKLLSFEFDMTQTKMREDCEVRMFLWHKDEDIKDMLPKIDKGLAQLFGDDYRSPENIRKYERHRDIARDIDPNIIAKYRIENGYSISKLASLADIPYQWITTSKETNKLSNNLQKVIGKVYGDDWNSLEKLRLYQKRLNKVGLVDGKRIKKLRAQREITRKQAAIDLKTSDDRISRIERNEVVLSSWVEYLRFKDYYQDDLLLRDETTGVKKRKRAKEVITFRNIATRGSKVSWQMIKKVRA